MTNKVFRSQWIFKSFAFSVSTCILHRMARMDMFAIFTIKICFITVTWRIPIGVGNTFSTVQTCFLIFCLITITISVKLTLCTLNISYLCGISYVIIDKFWFYELAPSRGRNRKFWIDIRTLENTPWPKFHKI